jgi:hypothetical protein
MEAESPAEYRQRIRLREFSTGRLSRKTHRPRHFALPRIGKMTVKTTLCPFSAHG